MSQTPIPEAQIPPGPIAESGGLTQTEVQVHAADLPLHCPTAAVKLWNAHPKVFLDVARTGHAACPYCGTRYTLVGPAPSGH